MTTFDTTDPLAVVSMLPLETGARWGTVAADFQIEDMRSILHGDRKMMWLSRPRGASKTSDVALAVLVILLLQAPPGSRSYIVAADSDQAGLTIDVIAQALRLAPSLGERIDVQARRVVNRRSGASFEVLSSDSASSFGLRPFVVVVDEFCQWPNTVGAKRLWQSIVSSVPKTPNARLVIISTSGDPGSWQAAVFRGAVESPEWHVREVAGPTPWWTADAIEEQRRLLPESAFRRLILNEWASPEDRLTSPEAVRDCVGHVGPLGPREGVTYCMAIDVGLVNDRTVLTVCHAEMRERGLTVVCDRQEVWSGTRAAPVMLADVEATVIEAWRAYGRPTLIADPWQFASTCQTLRGHGVDVREFTFSQTSIGRLAVTLYRLLRDRLLDLPDDGELIDELSNVRLRESAPGQYRIDHDSDLHDDRCISLGLACLELIEQGETRPAEVMRSAASRSLIGWAGPRRGV